MAPEMIDLASGERRRVCIDCGEPFAPSPAFRDAALPPPGRCPECAARRRDEHNQRLLEVHATGAARAAVKRLPGPDNGTGQLSSARCSGCGRDIRLPFSPRADRPVFCRDCWSTRNGM
ncbi:MAG: hypothetical protein IT337_01720 [Thermomicrobiales bacterium]|nr:hypothetical protein [Thermomicrobiales bacterium]